MKSPEQVRDWLKELKAERRDAVTKQMVFGNTGATNALRWVLDASPSEEELRLKISELQATGDGSIGDELAAVAYTAMVEALTWVLRED